MLAEWAECFREIALCAWWFNVMIIAVALGAILLIGIFGGLLGGTSGRFRVKVG